LADQPESFARATLVAMVTKIGKFYDKIGYNSACV